MHILFLIFRRIKKSKIWKKRGMHWLNWVSDLCWLPVIAVTGSPTCVSVECRSEWIQRVHDYSSERTHLHLLLKDDRYNFMEAALQLVFPRSFCCHAVNLSVQEGSKDSPEAKGQNSGEQGATEGRGWNSKVSDIKESGIRELRLGKSRDSV